MNPISNIIDEASKIVSPSWPLQSFVAVNPFWNLKEKSFYQVIPQLTHIYGQSLFLPLNVFVEKYNQGVINESNIIKSIGFLKEYGIILEQDCALFIRESLEANEHEINYQTYSDFVSSRESFDIKVLIVDEISKYCSSYFDLGQAPFSLKNSIKRLYLEWRDLILFDRAFEIFGDKSEIIKEIPEDPLILIEQCAKQLGILTESELNLYITKICHHMMGWCSHITFQLWQNNLELFNNNRGTKIEDIVALFMFYETLVYNSKKQFNNPWLIFYQQQKVIFSSKHMELDHNFKLLSVWQRAFELSYQEQIVKKIEKEGFQENFNQTKIKVQMVFCIDVRSEVIRRKIEENMTQISTYGFAGFFGVSLHCQHDNLHQETYHCPVLLQPKINIQKKFQKHFLMKRQGKNSLDRFLTGLKQGLASSFAYVEFFGMLSAFKILNKSKSNSSHSKKLIQQKFMKPFMINDSLTDVEKVETVNFVLTHLGIKEFSDVVLICGHGSMTTNNAFASSLDCGACGGQAGDLNARYLCQILNNEKVRKEIVKAGKFKIPENTIFIPALHETVSDEIYFLNKENYSDEIQKTLNELKIGFEKASKEAQQERKLISKNTMPIASERSTSWSEIRPDWALVKNASFIIAPRNRTKDINLEGRAFLHDYDYTQDEGMKTLELIMTAPMVVTNWINMQYYASSVCPATYGSGNKVLHNIEGLFGVLEGNSGDLKIGLPIQSVHDGSNLIHEPLRLSVFIDAPEVEIEKIIQRHSVVHNLVENQWLHIFVIDRNKMKVLYRHSSGNYNE